jgi:hypothetical protein
MYFSHVFAKNFLRGKHSLDDFPEFLYLSLRSARDSNNANPSRPALLISASSSLALRYTGLAWIPHLHIGNAIFRTIFFM